MKRKRQSKAELERIAKNAGVPIFSGVAWLNGQRKSNKSAKSMPYLDRNLAEKDRE